LVIFAGFSPAGLVCEYERRKSSASWFSLSLFRAAFRDLGTDANAKVAGAVGSAGAFRFRYHYFSKSLMPFSKAA
jgi:hypothetical protein